MICYEKKGTFGEHSTYTMKEKIIFVAIELYYILLPFYRCSCEDSK